jgi:hypothetical protein
VIKYFYNLLENDLWKLDSAQIECHY